MKLTDEAVRTPWDKGKHGMIHYNNIASKFVKSNSIAWACFIFLLCMTSANKSLKKKNFHRVENVIKQLVHALAVHLLRYEAFGKFGEHSRSYSCSQLCLEQLLCIFCALQTSRMLHILTNTCWHINQLLIISWECFIAIFLRNFKKLMQCAG